MKGNIVLDYMCQYQIYRFASENRYSLRGKIKYKGIMNHISLRWLWTPLTVFTVFKPLNLKVPPLKVDVKLLLQGKYFSWI